MTASGMGGVTQGGWGQGGGCGKIPEDVPVEWKEHSDYSCNCRVFVPNLLPSVEWGSCPPEAPTAGACRTIKENPNVSASTSWAQLSKDETNQNTIFFARAKTKNVIEYIAYNLDLKKTTAALIRVTEINSKCFTQPQWFSGNTYAIKVDGDAPSDPSPGELGHPFGVIAGSILEDSPRLSLKQKTTADNNLTAEWSVFDKGVVRNDGSSIDVIPWDLSTSIKVHESKSDPQKLPGFVRYAKGQDLIIKINSSGHTGILSWTATKGTRTLLRSGIDKTTGFGNFGTDGTTMVWTFGEGPPKAQYDYPKNTMMQSPFTTDPLELQKNATPVRDDWGPFQPNGYIVGCGYASRLGYDPTTNEGGYTSIIRLSDGAEWRLTQPTTTPMETIGITCEEIFLIQNPPRLLAIRLDSLGPPIVPPSKKK